MGRKWEKCGDWLKNANRGDKGGRYASSRHHQTENQLIIVENLEHIPDLDYEQSRVNVIAFTKGRYKDRYGFLNGVK